MTHKQLAAIKALDSAFKLCKSSGLAFCGIDDGLYCTPDDDAFRESAAHLSTCEAMLDRMNSHMEFAEIKTHGTYKDSGGA